MTLRLDAVIELGTLRFAALCRVEASGLRLGSGLVFHGSKKPVVILIGAGDTVQARRVDGSAMTLAEVEALCPGALERFGAG